MGGKGKYAHVSFCIKGCAFPENSTFIDSVSNKKYKIETNELYLYESVFDTKLEGTNIFENHIDGVQLRKFDDIFQNYFSLKSQNIFTEIAWVPMTSSFRYKFEEIPKQHIFNIIDKYTHIPYNKSIIDKLYVPFHTNYLIKNLKNAKDYLFGTNINNNGLLCTELIGHILIEFDLIQNINPNTLITEDFVYDTPSSFLKQFPKIYLEPLDIVEQI